MNFMLATALVVSLAGAQTDSVPLYDNLGDHHYAITAKNPKVQAYFDQGLRLYYAFNHQESIRSFRAAQRLDPSCTMCWWGEALAFGPNINLPMDSSSGVAAYAAIQRALEERHHATPRERAFIEALARRYTRVPPTDRTSLDSAYVHAMAELVEDFPDDHEAAVLYGESLMDLRPWNYWTADGESQPGMDVALANLQRVTAANPKHPGACHFYIHAVEAVYPDRAVECAERLAGLMPGAGHLVHMPGHIYIRVGRYLDAIEANKHAVHADETYIRDQQPGVGMYTAGYYPHNYDFLAFAETMTGRSRQAIEAADNLAALVSPDMLRAPGMSFLQHWLTRQLQVRVRFSRWDEILNLPAPAEDLVHARGMWHYARGRALAARGDVTGAAAELEQVRAAQAHPALEGVRLEFNQAPHVLAVAANVLAGRIAEARGEYDDAIDRLREAARLEDALTYGEPPEWTVPVRHDLGSVLVAAGRPEEAERVYRKDLERFRENGWSLWGLEQALRAQGRADEADAIRSRFRRAWSHADVELPNSTS